MERKGGKVPGMTSGMRKTPDGWSRGGHQKQKAHKGGRKGGKVKK